MQILVFAQQDVQATPQPLVALPLRVSTPEFITAAKAAQKMMHDTLHGCFLSTSHSKVLTLTSARSFAEPKRCTISALRPAAPTNGAACCTGGGSRCQNAAVLACARQAAALSTRRQCSQAHEMGRPCRTSGSRPHYFCQKCRPWTPYALQAAGVCGTAHLHAVNGWVQKIHILCKTDRMLSQIDKHVNLSVCIAGSPARCEHDASGKMEVSRKCGS